LVPQGRPLADRRFAELLELEAEEEDSEKR
jgi:hypothetical protein